ncbi:MAG: NAD-dependent epimerase/dehydratase family protein [Xanthobacteraceae bacterium]|nr:NAD-dependent epimerase/dehydratase family protein [Xanthobacteraceae bacterium]
MKMNSTDILYDDVTAIVEGLGPDAQRFAGKTVLLAGGAGFLGRHFIAVFRRLNKDVLSTPCKILSVDNYITGQQLELYESGHHDPNVTDVWADVSAPLPVRHDVHFIIHAAGVASPAYYMKYPLETIESAVQGTKNLLELARKNPAIEGFLFFSSSEIYGDPDPKAIPTPETYHGNVSSVGPRACYDESKRLGETISTIYQQQFNVPVTIVRPFNVFGPGMRHDDRRVIPMFTYEALNGRAIPVHGDGRQTRTFTYITDAISGFFKTLLKGRPGEAYNIGNSNDEVSMTDLAKMYSSVIHGSTVRNIPYPSTYPAGEPQRRCPDLTKAAEHLGYASQIDLQTGLARFVAWARDQESYKDR